MWNQSRDRHRQIGLSFPELPLDGILILFTELNSYQVSSGSDGQLITLKRYVVGVTQIGSRWWQSVSAETFLAIKIGELQAFDSEAMLFYG